MNVLNQTIPDLGNIETKRLGGKTRESVGCIRFKGKVDTDDSSSYVLVGLTRMSSTSTEYPFKKHGGRKYS